MNFRVLHEETPGWIKTQEGSKYEWIGKLNGDLNSNNTATDFPWGNDNTLAETTVGSPTAQTAKETTSGFFEAVSLAEALRSP